jgi:hypothetical protein
MRHETGHLAAPVSCSHALPAQEHPNDRGTGLPTFTGTEVRLADRYQQFPALQEWSPGWPASAERQAGGGNRLP